MSRNAPEKPTKSSSEADKRAKRLAEALRANLRRRKAAGQAQDAERAGKSQTDAD